VSFLLKQKAGTVRRDFVTFRSLDKGTSEIRSRKLEARNKNILFEKFLKKGIDNPKFRRYFYFPVT